jgi:hypothetical protein
MSQNLIPLDGGPSEVTISSVTPGIYLSQQFVDAKGLRSRPTEWLTSGRPIYDRLPSASETYKLFYSEQGDSAFVYIPVGESRAGRTSLNVISSAEGKFLVVQAGKIVWREGTIPLNPVLIDLEEIGMWNTKYLITYQIYSSRAPRTFQYEANSYSLSGVRMSVEGSTDFVSGWRYTSDLAFVGRDSRPWRNYDGIFPNYSGEAYLSWQSPFPWSLSKVVVRCPKGESAPEYASLSMLSCPTPTEEGQYCENPEWVPQFESALKEDDDGKFYEFIVPEPAFGTGWKVSWSGPKVSVYSVLVDGILTLEEEPLIPITVCKLAAYPVNSAPRTIELPNGDIVEPVYCDLANVQIDNSFTITQISDLRETVSKDYVPVTDWLTSPWDDNLKEMFYQASNYTPLWLAPTSSMRGEYKKLSDASITLEV